MRNTVTRTRSLDQQRIFFSGIKSLYQTVQSGRTKSDVGDFENSVSQRFESHCFLGGSALIGFLYQRIDPAPGTHVLSLVRCSVFVDDRILPFIGPSSALEIFLRLSPLWEQPIFNTRSAKTSIFVPYYLKRSPFWMIFSELIVQALPDCEQFWLGTWTFFQPRRASCGIH